MPNNGSRFINPAITLQQNSFVALANDYEYTSKWVKEQDVEIIKNILKRTDNTDAGELKDFWVGLSKQTHGGTRTTQSGLDMNETYGEYIGNIISTFILLYLSTQTTVFSIYAICLFRNWNKNEKPI